METADGRPSALAASLSSAGATTAAAEKEADALANGSKPRTFDVGSTSATAQGGAGRRMTAEERKAIEEAIDRSSSLEEIRQLEERLRLGYAVAA